MVAKILSKGEFFQPNMDALKVLSAWNTATFFFWLPLSI